MLVKYFRYVGINRNADILKGKIASNSMATAITQLRDQGIAVKNISREFTFLSRRFQKPKSGDISLFSRQLATLFISGIPLIQGLDIILKSQIHEGMKNLIGKIKMHLQTGLTLAESLRKYPRVFYPLYCNLIDAGEQSGSLDIMLGKIASYQEKMEGIRKKVKRTMAWPLTVMVAACFITGCLLIFVIPQFQSVFNSFGSELPLLTQIIIHISEMIRSLWPFILTTLVGFWYLFLKARQRFHAFHRICDKWILRIPAVGSILEKAVIARFSRTLSITFATGLPLVNALDVIAGTTGNLVFTDAIRNIRNTVSMGEPLHIAMEKTQIFPHMTIQMVAIGEASGTLETMLGKVAAYHEEAVDNSVETLNSLLEPVIMCILGILIGILVLALYLPIFKLGSVI